MTGACGKPCRECPFRRKSPRGYLGEASYDPEGFLAPHFYGDVRLPCHMRVDWVHKDRDAQTANAPLCKGFITMCKNQAKMPLDQESADAVMAVERDTGEVFTHHHEFIEHHKKPGGKP